MNSNLTDYIKRYVHFSTKEIEIFNSFLKLKKVKKKEFLLKEGQRCKSRYFIIKGCIRLFYINDKGDEQIIHFGIDNWWITNYESLVNKIPSKLYIQAIEDTELLELPDSIFDELSYKVPKVERLFRKIMEKTYIASQKRIEFINDLSGEDFLETFISSNPHFSQRVPQYMIASYLGLSPEFVSKVRGRKK